MSAPGAQRRPLGPGTATFCAMLDAFAMVMDLKAASGSFPLLRTPLAIGARATSTIVRYWSSSWIGTYLGLSWVFLTYQRGKQPPRPPRT